MNENDVKETLKIIRQNPNIGRPPRKRNAPMSQTVIVTLGKKNAAINTYRNACQEMDREEAIAKVRRVHSDWIFTMNTAVTRRQLEKEWPEAIARAKEIFPNDWEWRKIVRRDTQKREIVAANQESLPSKEEIQSLMDLTIENNRLLKNLCKMWETE